MGSGAAIVLSPDARGRSAQRARPSCSGSQADSGSVRLQTDAQIKDAIKEAEESCEGDNKGECAAAWDTVEELSAAASHKKSVRRASVQLMHSRCAARWGLSPPPHC